MWLGVEGSVVFKRFASKPLYPLHIPDFYIFGHRRERERALFALLVVFLFALLVVFVVLLFTVLAMRAASSTTLEPLSKWFLWSLFTFSAVAGSLFGYDTGIVSGALVSVRAEFSLTNTQTEWFVSATPLSSAFGSLLSVLLNDAFGRRPVIFIGAFTCMVGASCLGLATSYNTLIVGRVLIGSAIGLTSVTAPMYAAELAPPASRGMVVVLNDFSIVAGQVVAGGLNVAFLYVTDGWRYAMGLACVPAMMLVLAMLPLPESPRWLYLRGDREASRTSLMVIHGVLADGSAEGVAEAEFDRMCQSLDDEARLAGGAADEGVAAKISRSLIALVSEAPLRRSMLLGILLMGLNQLSGINTVMYYSASIFEARYGIEVSVWLAAACDCAQLVGVLISLATIDSHGRRLTGLRSAGLVTLSLIGLSVSYGVHFSGASSMGLAFTLAYLVAFGSGLSGVGWVVVSEIYPMRVRATAVAVAVFANWMFNFLVSQSFLTLVESMGYCETFGLYAAFSIVGGCLMYRYLPETSGARLEDIERQFHDPYPSNIVRSQPSEAAKEGSALLPPPK